MSSSLVDSEEEPPAVTSQPNKRSLGTASERTVQSKGDEHCSETGPMLEDFPVDSSNPFETAFCSSDLVLVVEGKKLHVHRAILSLYSSYFRVMLNSHFAEADAEEIELKGSEDVKMKYEAMVKFLLHLYPVHSFKSITDDRSLMDLLPLAEYFQCQHVRAKCEAYIRQQLTPVGLPGGQYNTQVSAASALLYLRLCEKYELKQFFETLLELLSQRRLPDMVYNNDFKCLTPETQRDVLHRRANFVEQRLDSQVREARWFISSKRCDAHMKCSKCSDSSKYCCVVCDTCCAKFKDTLKDSQSA